MTKWRWAICLFAVLLACLPLIAQESTVRGTLAGVVVDQTGAVVSDAKTTLTGPTGTKTIMSESDGRFSFPLLTPGMYKIKVEKTGFKTAELGNLEVAVGRIASVTVTLQPGAATETVEVTGTAVTVDTTSTSVGANLADTFYQQVPVARNVASLFYIAPGAADSGGAGRANPSVSGASGLENLYVADGVNITDSAFGGLGVFTRREGSIGSGINLSFIKEVNVKTSGFEPQYGQADGGVVQLVTKSGTNQYHGEIGGYFAPQGTEASYIQTDPIRTNKSGFFLHRANYDVDGEFGGPVPGFKDHLFFFGSLDPTWAQQFLGASVGSGLAAQYPNGLTLFARTWNYAGKLTWKINDNHQIESSIFGDPTNTNTSEVDYVLNAPNDTGESRLHYGTRNWVVRYNGTLSPTWLVNGSFTWNHNYSTQFPKYDVVAITDRTVSTNIHSLQGFGYLENHETNSYALNADTQKIFHAWGTHTFSVGYRYERPNYNDIINASGGRADVPTTNMVGAPLFNCTPGDFTCPIGQTAFQWAGSLRASPMCTVCPLYPVNGVLTPVYVQFGRGEFNPSANPTHGRYHAAYVNDSWQMSNRVTLSLGWRWEQWRMAGIGAHYTFTDNWAPRIGLSVDPFGDRKTKIFGNFARYNYQTPLDAAIRELGAEQDIIGLAYAPANTGGIVDINPNGSINIPVADGNYVLNNVPGAISYTGGHIGNVSLGGSRPTPFVIPPGTKLQYQDEFVFGAEHEFKGGLVLSGRFIYRTIPRALDDVAGVSPEAYVNNPNEEQFYFLTNPGPGIDLFPNEHEAQYTPGDPASEGAAGCTPAALAAGTAYAVDQITDVNGGLINPATGGPWGNGLGSCWTQVNGYWGGEQAASGYPIADGVPDGFPQVRHIYKAVELELNKSFAHYWMLRANWRIASLTGNYEGAYRNDNGQTDPNISSLFDFTNGIINMLGDQYAPGPLNTDRRHIINVYASYVVPKTIFKNFELGAGVNILSGIPITKLANHPAYGNSGEVPLGGRGALGRTPISGGVNLHADRPFKLTEKMNLHLTADLFNIADNRPVLYPDETYQINFATTLNPDFLKPNPVISQSVPGYQRPFYARFAVRFTF